MKYIFSILIALTFCLGSCITVDEDKLVEKCEQSCIEQMDELESVLNVDILLMIAWFEEQIEELKVWCEDELADCKKEEVRLELDNTVGWCFKK